MLKDIKLIKLSDFPSMDVGAPIPTVFADELEVILLYYLKSANLEFDANGELPAQEIASITFKSYLQYKFGSPNDEALNGHKYYKYGLKPNSFYEVQNSDFIDELEKMNRIHPRHSAAAFSKFKHFLGTFHDSCFEIVFKHHNVQVLSNVSMRDCLNNSIKNKFDE